MIQDMINSGLVDGLIITETKVNGKCEDCIMGHQTHRPFDGETEKDLEPLEPIAFDLWGLSHVQSVGGKIYFMIIVDAGTSYKSGGYLPDKSDESTIPTLDLFQTRAEMTAGKKLHRLQSDGAYNLAAWANYCQHHRITHEVTALYLSAQNGLAEWAIRMTMVNVCTLLNDSNLGHSYWAKAAAYLINTQNLIPSHRHPGCIPVESFSGK